MATFDDRRFRALPLDDDDDLQRLLEEIGPLPNETFQAEELPEVFRTFRGIAREQAYFHRHLRRCRLRLKGKFSKERIRPEALRQAMQGCSMTPQQISDALGSAGFPLSPSRIHAFIRGEEAPEYDTLAMISAALGVPMDSLMATDQPELPFA